MWLAFEEDQQRDSNWDWDAPLTLLSLPVAVSIDIVNARLDHETIPRPSDISDWCGSLVHLDPASNKLTFSHFSVKEFLTTNKKKVPSIVARKYLLNESRDKKYMAAVCLTYLSLPGLPNIIDFDDDTAVQGFDKKYPFYAHAAGELTSYLRYVEQSTTEPLSVRKFFTPRANCYFTLWFQYIAFHFWYVYNDGHFALDWDPLHLAVGLRLVRTVRRLLSEGANVNALAKGGIPPIAFALSNRADTAFNNHNFGSNAYVYFVLPGEKQLSMPILELLISHGADLTCEFQIWELRTLKDFVFNPFCGAFTHLEVDACRILLEHGAKVEEGMFGMAFSFLEDCKLLDEAVAILEMVLSGPWIQSTELRTRLVNFMSGSSSDDVGDSEGCSEKSDELIIAMKFANEAAFDHLLNSGTDVEVRNSKGETALYIAIAMENKEFTSKLLRCGANIHAATPDGETPLPLAYKIWGHSEVQEIFSSRECFEFTSFEKFHVLQLACANWDADFLNHIFSRCKDFRNEDGPLPLYAIRPIKSAAVLRMLQANGLLHSAERYRAMLEACKCGDEEVLREAFAQCTKADVAEFRSLGSTCPVASQIGVTRLLLENGLSTLVDINRMLLTACEEANVELAAFLLSSGANANFLGIDGSRPVHQAAHNSQILQRLGEKGADIKLRDLNGETALHWAARKGSVDSVEWLLANGAVINSTSGLGHTPLHVATENGHEQVCRILLELGADCEQHTNTTRSTPLHRAVGMGNFAVVEILLDFNADPWARNKWKDTPLHVASRMGHADIVEKLLHTSAGAATLESVEENARRPLHEAAAQNNAIICQILLKAGARLDHVDNDGCSPLVLAIQRGHHLTVNVLLEACPSIATIDPVACPPLHASVKDIGLLSRLLDWEVDVNAVDNDGNTALHLAAEVSACASIQLILERKPNLAVISKNYMTALDVIEENRQPGWEVGAALLRDAGAKNGATRSHVDCLERFKPKLHEESGVCTARPRESNDSSLLSNDATSMPQSLFASRRASSSRIQALLQELEFLCGAQSSQPIQEMPIRSAAAATLVDSAIMESETIADVTDHSAIDRDCEMIDS
jgi:ankyrin repeat protein